LLAGGEERFIRILAWASFTAARHFIRTVVERAIGAPSTHRDQRGVPQALAG
jgi:hypothetical protein